MESELPELKSHMYLETEGCWHMSYRDLQSTCITVIQNWQHMLSTMRTQVKTPQSSAQVDDFLCNALPANQAS